MSAEIKKKVKAVFFPLELHSKQSLKYPTYRLRLFKYTSFFFPKLLHLSILLTAAFEQLQSYTNL